MRIGVDCDGVLARFNEGFIDLIVRVTGRDLFPPRPFDIPCWDYPARYGYTDAETSLAWRAVKDDPGFWRNLSAYDDVERQLWRLSELCSHTHDCYFITSRVGIQCKRQTERWLAAHGFSEPTVLITSHKGLAARTLSLDVYIDDRWENALDVETTGTRSYLLTQPWNRDNDAHAAGVTRIERFEHFVNGIDC